MLWNPWRFQNFETASNGAIAVFPDLRITAHWSCSISEGGEEALTLDAAQAAALSVLPEGEWIEFTLVTTVAWEVPDLASVDSIWLSWTSQ